MACVKKAVRRLAFVVAAVLLATFVARTAISLAVPFPAALNRPTPATLTLADIHGREIALLPSAAARAQTPVTMAEMGPWLPKLSAALEDRRFYSHHGIDWPGTVSAAWRNLTTGRIVRGGSTISQQLIKLASDRRQRTWSAKVYEMLAAWKLERQWSKERILAEYLNRCQYGNRLVGPEAAARWYFGKAARDLNLSEAVFLAGLPQAPSRFNPWHHPAAAERRRQRTIAVLAAQGVITRDESALLAQTLPTVGRHLPAHEAPHFVEAFRAALPAVNGPVRTTLDLDLQHSAEEFARAHLRTLHRNDIPGAAIVILENSTGAVRALVGSPDFRVSQINSALHPHSCGSTLKPFVYLRAIDTGLLTASSLLPDTPDAIRDAYADYDPQDYNRRYLGPVRLREALACSLNVPAVIALSKVGARRAFFDLQRWGFQFPRKLDDYGAGFILGNAEVRLLDLAAAYAGLARGGLHVDPEFIPRPRRVGERLASSEAAAIIADILCDNEARARSFGLHSPLDLGVRVAAKTGTSSGFRDTWTVGFTRQHTVAVWVGNPNGHPMREALSIRAATPLWSALVNKLLQDDSPVPPPIAGEKLVAAQVCRLTGLLPAAASPEVISEWFLAGTQPTETADAWFALGPDRQTHLLLPGEYAAWCQSRYNTIGALHPASQELKIIAPTDQATFEIEPSIQASQQMLELSCTGAIGRSVRWFANDQEVAPRPDGRVFWALTPGAWRISACADDQKAAVSITVE